MMRKNDLIQSVVARPGEDALCRTEEVVTSDDPWAALLTLLEGQRAINADCGGDDISFIVLVAFQTAILTLPVRNGGRK